MKKFIKTPQPGDLVKVYSHEQMKTPSITGRVLPSMMIGSKFGIVMDVRPGSIIKIIDQKKVKIYSRELVYLNEIIGEPEKDPDFYLPYYKCKLYSSLKFELFFYSNVCEELRKEMKDFEKIESEYLKLKTDGNSIK